MFLVLQWFQESYVHEFTYNIWLCSFRVFPSHLDKITFGFPTSIAPNIAESKIDYREARQAFKMADADSSGNWDYWAPTWTWRKVNQLPGCLVISPRNGDPEISSTRSCKTKQRYLWDPWRLILFDAVGPFVFFIMTYEESKTRAMTSLKGSTYPLGTERVKILCLRLAVFTHCPQGSWYFYYFLLRPVV